MNIHPFATRRTPGVTWHRLPEPEDCRDGWRHYVGESRGGQIHVMGDVEAVIWHWRLVRDGAIVGRGEIEREPGERLALALKTADRQAYVATRIAA